MIGLNDFTKQRKKPAKTNSLSWFFMTFSFIAIFRRFYRVAWFECLLLACSIH